jgi:hypothetical protein
LPAGASQRLVTIPSCGHPSRISGRTIRRRRHRFGLSIVLGVRFPIELATRAVLDLQCSLFRCKGAMVDNPDTTYTHYSFILGDHISNIAIEGLGIIDGHRSVRRGPKLIIALKNCRRVIISGLTLRNPPSYNISLLGSEYAEIDHLRILNGYSDGTRTTRASCASPIAISTPGTTRFARTRAWRWGAGWLPKSDCYQYCIFENFQ